MHWQLSLRYIFILGVPAAGLSTLSAFLIRDINLKIAKKSVENSLSSDVDSGVRKESPTTVSA
jgi:adenylate kinase family enzyme